MSNISDLLQHETKDLPPILKFVREPVEDAAASAAAGHYVARDVDYVVVYPRFSAGNNSKFKIAAWKSNMENDVRNNRFRREWMEQALHDYELWSKGQEIPLRGVPIKGWGVISPAQQETLIRLNILTVEDLSACNDEGMRRIGMGAVELKTKAGAWLAQLQDKGPLTQEIAALKNNNALLQANVETLTRQVAELLAQAKAGQGFSPQQVADQVRQETGIAASDILDENTDDLVEQYRSKFGQPPHHRMKRETIERALRE